MFSYEMGLFANRFLLSRFGCEKGAVVPARKVGEQREAAEELGALDLLPGSLDRKLTAGSVARNCAASSGRAQPDESSGPG